LLGHDAIAVTIRREEEAADRQVVRVDRLLLRDQAVMVGVGQDE